MKGRNFSPSLYLSFVIQHFAKKTKEVKNKHVHICIGIQLIGLEYPESIETDVCSIMSPITCLIGGTATA
jgi:hypothetical protein